MSKENNTQKGKKTASVKNKIATTVATAAVTKAATKVGKKAIEHKKNFGRSSGWDWCCRRPSSRCVFLLWQQRCTKASPGSARLDAKGAWRSTGTN